MDYDFAYDYAYAYGYVFWLCFVVMLMGGACCMGAPVGTRVQQKPDQIPTLRQDSAYSRSNCLSYASMGIRKTVYRNPISGPDQISNPISRPPK